MHHLVNAKKRSSNYKHLRHYVIDEVKDKVSFRLNDEKGEVVVCDIDFYPAEDLIDMECSPCDFRKLESLLVFDLLESISEKAFARFLDTKFYYSGSQFFVITDGPKPIVYRVSPDRNTLNEVADSRIYREIMEENSRLDLF